jgi:hypothetical protein
VGWVFDEYATERTEAFFSRCATSIAYPERSLVVRSIRPSPKRSRQTSRD